MNLNKSFSNFMTKTSKPNKELCTLINLTDCIKICHVDIGLFIKTCLPEISSDTYTTKRSIIFKNNKVLEEILSPDEMEMINSLRVLKKQVERICGRLAIKTLVSKHYDLPMRSVQIGYEAMGAPFLKNFPEKSISISHSANLATAALSLNEDITVGVDIEKIVLKFSDSFIATAFSTRELSYIKDQPMHQTYLNWTAKEAYLKHIKKGFNESLKKVEIINGEIHHNSAMVKGLTIISEKIHKEYAFTAVFSNLK